uniref:Uncharacterized protein n=1 Tax=Anguilla anguilla TaxID=7936 RepID=A0A0E9QG03_ANGAN
MNRKRSHRIYRRKQGDITKFWRSFQVDILSLCNTD